MVLSEAQILALPIPLQIYFRELEYGIIRQIAELVKHIGEQETPDPYRVAYKVDRDVRKIEDDIQKAIAGAEKLVFAALMRSAMMEGSFEGLERLVEEISRATFGTMFNISDSSVIGGRLHRRGQFLPIRSLYQQLTDHAILQVRLGQTPFYDAMRATLRAMAQAGIRYMSWQSGYTQRIDSTARRNLLGGLARLSHAQADMIREQTGTDGYEISWHSGHRPSHDFGGLQFRAREYHSRILPMMQEPNCYHRSFAIMYGVSTPTYSRQQLAAFEREEKRPRYFEGKAYTAYEAQQRQRRIETSIREAKDVVNVLDAVGDAQGLRDAKIRVRMLNARYTEFSRAMGIPTQPDRTRVI